jgi:dTDP-4-amino-4,6-dideoxygalactose transaminase
VELTRTLRVPLFDGAREYRAHAQELLGAAGRVLASGHYVLSREGAAFEREVAGYLDVPHAIGVASGTDALELALRATGTSAGGGVITSPLTFFATISAIIRAGGVPIFADVEPGTLTLDAEAVRSIATGGSRVHDRLDIRPEQIRSVVPVHLHGQPADLDGLVGVASDAGLALVEDAAQAMGAIHRGARSGSIGDAGSFSFFPTKCLGGFGDGGMTVTKDPAVAQQVRLLRAHGAMSKHRHVTVGTNSRLDELQAALLRVRFAHLDRSLALRARHAAAYDRQLADLECVRTPPRMVGRTHAHHQYVIRVDASVRDAVRAGLAAEGVETGVHYPVPAHLQEAVASLGYRAGDFPVAEVASQEMISLPMFPNLTDDELRHVVGALRRILNASQE